MPAACAAAGETVVEVPKIDGADDVWGDEKALAPPNALLENRLLLFEFSEVFGWQMEKSLKIEPTSDEAVVAVDTGAAADGAVDDAPKPPNIEPDVELAADVAKLKLDGAVAVDGFASLASDITDAIESGGAFVGVSVAIPNTLLANGEAALLELTFTFGVIPRPLKIEEVSDVDAVVTGTADVIVTDVFPKIVAFELELAAVAKLNDVTGEAIDVVATEAVTVIGVDVSEALTRFNGAAVLCADVFD